MARRAKGEGSWDTVIKNGITYYRFRKKYDGMKYHKEFTGKTKSEVKQKVNAYEAKTVRVIDSDYNKIILEDCIKNVLDTLKMTTKSSNYATYLSTFRCYIQTNKIKDYQMANIDKKVIQDFYFELANKYSESTVKKTRTLFNVIFNYLVDMNIITENPAKGIKMPHSSKYATQPKPHSFMSLEESEKFYNAAMMKATDTTPGVRTGDYIYGRNAHFCIIILYTGMRVGEAYGLTWKDVDFENNTISINKTKERIKINNKYEWKIDTPKRKSSYRTIPIADRAKASLLHLKALTPNAQPEDEIFVTARGISPSQGTLTRTLHAIMNRAGIDSNGFGLHDLRHSFGSMLLEKGWKQNIAIDIKVVSELLGHKDITTTYNIYTHILSQHKAEAVNILN